MSLTPAPSSHGELPLRTILKLCMEPTVFLCQQCKTRILISASDAEPPLPGPGEVPSALEESFMQLEDTLYGPRGESSPREWDWRQ